MNRYLRSAEEKILHGLCSGCALLAAITLFVIIGTIFIEAIPSLSWYFILTPESRTPGLGQGIANAIVGTIVLSICSTIIATPLAFGTAVYLQRYAKESVLTRGIRFFIEVLSGTPSVILGAFGLLAFVYYMKAYTGGFSLISGSVALAILIIPVIERSLEQAIESVPRDMEEGSFALGATKWQTIAGVTIPYALSGLMTGMILGFGRAAEESAVVILTAGYTQHMPEIAIKAKETMAFGVKIYPFQDLIGSLPYAVYHAYENNNVIPMSNGFAVAFILICIVLIINVSVKIFISRRVTVSSQGRRSGGFLPPFFRRYIGKNSTAPPEKHAPPAGTISPVPDIGTDIGSTPVKTVPEVPEKIDENLETATISTNMDPGTNTAPIDAVKKRLRVISRFLLPFLIPAILLVAIATLATLSPLRGALGPASPSLATAFGIGLSGIIAIAGIVFGLLFAKKAGAFKAKNRKAGRIGIAAGICLILVSGIVCATAAPGFFVTGDQPAASGEKLDRKAQLEALLMEMGDGEEGGSSVQVQSDPVVSGQSSSKQQQVATGTNATAGVTVPVKDALSLGEVYQYGDASHRVSATVYDYRVLPYYFWWFIDYNRFVQSVPANGNSYLVVFIRLENTGSKSIIIPTADQFVVENNGKKYERHPYMNLSVISSYQATELRNANTREQYYQWIRELGQDKRDYAYLTGEMYYEDLWAMNQTANSTSSSRNSTSDNSTVITEYDWFYLKPGPGHAIDGYLVYDVPDEILRNPENLMMTVSFNQNSGTRWRLKHT
jgi:phosphate transport system permease protein